MPKHIWVNYASMGEKLKTKVIFRKVIPSSKYFSDEQFNEISIKFGELNQNTSYFYGARSFKPLVTY